MKKIILFCVLFSVKLLIAQPFFAEDFSNGFPNDWTTESLTQNTTLFDFCEFSDTTCNLQPIPFLSTSAENGFLATRPQNFEEFTTRLTTPVIDCSQKNTVFIEFQLFIITWTVSAADGLSLLVKNENSPWERYEILPEQLIGGGTQQLSRNAENITIDISDIAAGNAEVEIRWEWTGIGEEVLMLDDVMVFEEEPYYERVIWGNLSGQGDFNGGINDWEIRTIEPLNDTAKTWNWRNFGQIDDALIADRDLGFISHPFINSYSNHDGAMVLNADFFTTNGMDRVAPPFPNYEAELISPIIDLSDVENDINLRFEQMVMFAGSLPLNYPFITTISHSIDGGNTWLDTIVVNGNIRFNELHESTPEVSLCGLAGESDVRLRFTFSGDLYFWVIDDVVLIEKQRDEFDIKSDFFARTPNFQTPADHVEPVRFLADIENIGINDQDNVWFHSMVYDKADASLVYIDSLFLGEIKSCELKENTIDPAFSFLPPEMPAEYEVRHTLSFGNGQSLPPESEIKWDFEITENTYAKENGFTVGIEPTQTNDFEYGNVFFIEEGNGFSLDSVTFGIVNTRPLRNLNVDILIYKFFEDTNNDLFADPNEYELIGAGVYTFNGFEDVVSNGLITTEVFARDGLTEGVKLEGGHYMVTVRYTDQIGVPCQMQASQDFDYTATFFLYDSLNIPRYNTVERISSERFDFISLGFDLVPIIRIHVNKVTTSVAGIKPEGKELIVYPNPTNDFIHFSNVNEGRMRLYDVEGKLLMNQPIQKESPIDVRNLSSGIYFINAMIEDEVFYNKFYKIE